LFRALELWIIWLLAVAVAVGRLLAVAVAEVIVLEQ
jgi:hypothetical protein